VSAAPARIVMTKSDGQCLSWESVVLWLAGLRVRLCGPYSRRFLVHRTTMDRRIVSNLFSHSRILASTTKARQTPWQRIPLKFAAAVLGDDEDLAD
jgi:hypothetical protein